MTENLLKFVTVEKQMPDKRDAAVRRSDFREIFGAYETQATTSPPG